MLIYVTGIVDPADICQYFIVKHDIQCNSYNDNRLSRVEIPNILVMMFQEVEGYIIVFINSERGDNISNIPQSSDLSAQKPHSEGEQFCSSERTFGHIPGTRKVHSLVHIVH